MLSFNRLGNLGRLANQMFQYSSLKGIAANTGQDWMMAEVRVFGQDDFNVRNTPHNIYTVFPAIQSLDGTERVGHSDFKLHPEQTHNFDENLFKNCPKNVDLFGYYQSPKYFENIEDELRNDFKFSEEVLGECQNMFDTLELISSDFISLHIRRGDYVYNPNHPVQPIEYYEKALEQMPKDLPVIVFSDDSDWCKTHEFFESDRFMIAEDNEDHYDLCLMSMCGYHIIANSSFSWWGAWLAKSKKIIAPKNWFGAECVYKEVHDMEFGNWSWL